MVNQFTVEELIEVWQAMPLTNRPCHILTVKKIANFAIFIDDHDEILAKGQYPMVDTHVSVCDLCDKVFQQFLTILWSE